MAKAQQPEIGRSGHNALDPVVEGTADVSESPDLGPLPEDNAPGHHPERDQDKPDLDDFAAKMGIRPDPPGDAPGADPQGPEGGG